MAVLGRCEVYDVCDLEGVVSSLSWWTADIEEGRRIPRGPMQTRFLCFARRVTVGRIPQVVSREHILRLVLIDLNAGSPEDAV